MTTDLDDDPPYEPPAGFCRHLLVCRTIWYTGDPDDGFSLGRVLVHVRPVDGNGFPIHAHRLFLFAQLFGTPGEYAAWLRLVRVVAGEAGEEDSTLVDEFSRSRPFRLPLVGEDFVESFAIPLDNVPFDQPGVYEFQLWLDGFDDPVAVERVEAKE